MREMTSKALARYVALIDQTTPEQAETMLLCLLCQAWPTRRAQKN
jgi:hypothetical protein